MPWVPAWCHTRARDNKSHVSWCHSLIWRAECTLSSPLSFTCSFSLMSQGLTIHHSTWSSLSLQWRKCFCHLQLVHSWCLPNFSSRILRVETIPSSPSTPHPFRRASTLHLMVIVDFLIDLTVDFLIDLTFSKDTLFWQLVSQTPKDTTCSLNDFNQLWQGHEAEHSFAKEPCASAPDTSKVVHLRKFVIGLSRTGFFPGFTPWSSIFLYFKNFLVMPKQPWWPIRN